MNSDFKDLSRIFAEEGVEYMIVGAYAVIHYTQPCYTKDIDLSIKPSEENSWRVAKAFFKFGLPLIEVTREDFAKEGLQNVVGVSPCQIDFLTSLPGPFNYESAWASRFSADLDGISVHFLGKNELLAAKKLAARPQDLAAIDEIRRAE